VGFRFHRRVRVLPGVRVNVTGRGLSSMSIGRRGATVNLSGRGARLTLGLPGTGLSYTTATARPWRRPRPEHAGHAAMGLRAAPVNAAEGGDEGTARAFARGFGRGLTGGGLVAGAVITAWRLGAWALGAVLLTAAGVIVTVRRGRPHH
jgi:hypothetical protein